MERVLIFLGLKGYREMEVGQNNIIFSANQQPRRNSLQSKQNEDGDSLGHRVNSWWQW